MRGIVGTRDQIDHSSLRAMMCQIGNLTIVGNVVDEPKLRETNSGVKVLSFRIASTSRRYDREQERWIDNVTMYATVTCWRWLAENVAASVHKGQPVVATGHIYTREYRKD